MAGVLNIVMKKAQNDYFGGNISADAFLFKGRVSPSLSTGLNYKQGRISASLNLDGSHPNTIGTFDTYRTAPSTQLYSASSSLFDYQTRSLNIRGGLDYTINPELTVGFTATYAPNSTQIDRTNETRNYSIRPDGSHDLLLRLPGTASETEHEAYTALNLHLEKTFAKAPGRKISWDADYVGSRTSSDDHFASTGYHADGSPAPDNNFAYKGHKGQRVHSYLTNVDVTLPLGQTILAFGARVPGAVQTTTTSTSPTRLSVHVPMPSSSMSTSMRSTPTSPSHSQPSGTSVEGCVWSTPTPQVR